MERYAFDLHLHSCLSPCGGEDNTPANLAGMCALAGLEVAALTDHNTCGNCAAFCRAAERYGLAGPAGDGAHHRRGGPCGVPVPRSGGGRRVFRPGAGEAAPIPNNPAVFGPQLYLDEKDRPLGEETAFLAGAAAIGIYEAAALVRAHGGVAYPAHIDRPSFSLLANLGLWDPAMGFPVAETSRGCPPDLFQRPDLRGWPISTPATHTIWTKSRTPTSICPSWSGPLRRF